MKLNSRFYKATPVNYMVPVFVILTLIFAFNGNINWCEAALFLLVNVKLNFNRS